MNLENLGLIARRREKYRKAVDFLQQAGELFEQLGDRADLARVWCHLGMVMRATGNLAKAERLSRESLKNQYELNDLTGQARSQVVLGLVAGDNGNWSIAREMFSEARTAFASMGVYPDLIMAESWLALCEAVLGNQQACDMLARDIEDRLRARPVYRNTLVEGLNRLVESVDAHNRELAWAIQDRSRAIHNRLTMS